MLKNREPDVAIYNWKAQAGNEATPWANRSSWRWTRARRAPARSYSIRPESPWPKPAGRWPSPIRRDGWVEHDSEAIFRADSVAVMRECRAVKGRTRRRIAEVAALGHLDQPARNHRRGCLGANATYDPGAPIHPAIVWQDRRTAAACDELRAAGLEAEVVEATGLVLDPYFSATKIAWILDQVDGARGRAEAGELLAGTIDAWLVWKLTGGRVHATDATNASRTLLMDLESQSWSETLCAMFRVPMAPVAGNPRPRCSADYRRDPWRATSLGGARRRSAGWPARPAERR